MAFAALVKGLALGLMLSISVGPVIFTIIKQSINNGHKGGYFFIAGVSASDITLVVICNLFTTIFQSAIAHERTIGIAGSVFLIVLGIYNCFFKKVVIASEEHVKSKVFRKRDLAAIFFSGFFMNSLNPGALLFWFAASATILADSKTEAHPIQYRIIIFATCLIFVFLSDLAKVLLAGKIRSKLTAHNIHIINRISGLILMGFGVALIWGILSHNSVMGH
ncbi:Threonine/homoserine/homoserine lactone efflux protein [Filimonas lacunae]|uniref:Threonine/homoserine/homoserine lactone efflux protein n=1 Tax=Filimonas lacunae TaxID=477680 RepID=A0A1N7LRP8_9BACT|nr:LysE family translocator [Filimonas lacunae]SIS76429.1 Threonine/homoserine/homoserine lactone efflux protein [Filimonas lacunae]